MITLMKASNEALPGHLRLGGQPYLGHFRRGAAEASAPLVKICDVAAFMVYSGQQTESSDEEEQMPDGKLVFMVDICVEPDDDGYHAFSPALKGLHTWGATEAEAVENAKDAALAYLESLIKHHEPIPVGIVAVPNGARKRVSVCPRQVEASLSLATA